MNLKLYILYIYIVTLFLNVNNLHGIEEVRAPLAALERLKNKEYTSKNLIKILIDTYLVSF